MKIQISKMAGGFGLVCLLSSRLCAVEAPLNVKESALKFTGHAFMHDFTGEAKEFSGSAQIDPKNPQIVESAKIEIKTAKMTTLESSRDSNMYGWLKVDQNPAITFELKSVKASKGDSVTATKEKPAEFKVGGNLTLNKTSKPVEAVATGWREGKGLVVAGKTKVDTTAYGLPVLGAGPAAVGKEVDIDFRLVFDLPAELQLGAGGTAGQKLSEPASKPNGTADVPPAQPKAGQ